MYANVATLGLLGATLDKELTEMAKTERGAFVSVCTHPTPRVKAKLFRHQQDAYDFALEIFKQACYSHRTRLGLDATW